MAKISIIVPVYNAKRFLKRCLNSLITQTYENIEILCVDDGSSDISYSMLLDYEKKDSRVHAFIQANKGPGPAKNLGLQNATGDFVMFCDADDYYEPTMCEEMIACVQNEQVDLAVCNIFVLQDDKNIIRRDYNGFYLRNFGKYDLSGEDKPFILGVVWNKIFRMEIIKKYQINFVDMRNLGNDISFMYKYTLASSSVFLLKKKLYNYVLNSTSICENLGQKGILDGYMLTAKDILQFCYHNEISIKRWCCKEFNTWLVDWFKDRVANYKILNNTLQEMSEYIPDRYYDDMPFFAAKVKRKIKPVYCDNPNCFIFSTNDQYAPYLDVALISLLENSDKTKNYDICILYTELSEKNKKRLLLLERENFSIRFVCVTSILSEMDKNIFYTCLHFSIEVYFRFFILSIFSQYQKICYLDCDMIFLKDMANVFEIEIDDYPLAAVFDYKNKTTRILNKNIMEYSAKVLKMLPDNYFNSGMLLLNIPKLLENDFLNNCIKKLQEIKNPRCVDQDVLNSLYSNSFKNLSPKWNLQLNVDKNELKKFCSYAEFLEYENASINPYVLHYCTSIKPWNSFDGQFDPIWWKYARKSTFYEEILLKFIK